MANASINSATKRKKAKKILLVVEVSKETKHYLNEIKTKQGINKNIAVKNAIQQYYEGINN